MNRNVEITPMPTATVVNFRFFLPYLAMAAAGKLRIAGNRSTMAAISLRSHISIPMRKDDKMVSVNNSALQNCNDRFLSNISQVVVLIIFWRTFDLLDLCGDLFNLLSLGFQLCKIHSNIYYLGKDG